MDYRCKKHKLPFDFWVKDAKIYYCKRCAAENRNICFKVIEDVIHDIKMDLSLDVQAVKKKIENDLELLEEKNSQLIKAKVNAVKFVELINSLGDEIDAQVEQIDAFMLEANRAATNVTEKVEKNIEKVKSKADIHILMESKETLLQFMKTSIVTFESLRITLLNKIICSYMVRNSTVTWIQLKSVYKIYKVMMFCI